MAPGCQKAPEAVQHLCAKRFRSVQNYLTLLPKGSWEKSSEAKPGLKKAIRSPTVFLAGYLLSATTSFYALESANFFELQKPPARSCRNRPELSLG
uniref:Deltameth_res domain-containing protein n=1 Tax=Heterorhabditis bacteriophora TaxID=37862 RepID=A0A1I7XDS5_HETBA